MKFRVLCAIALCICLGQLCSATNKYTEEKIKGIKDDLQYKIHGVGEQFVEDITTILDHTPSNPYFIRVLSVVLVGTLGRITLNQNNTKFSVSDMLNNLTRPDYRTSLPDLDPLKILESTLSKEFPPERYNGIINMFYINNYPNATAEEIANTLNYLDGTDNAATKISYFDLHNFPDPVASDCPDVTRVYSEFVDKSRSMIDIKAKVFEDFASIQEKFPCSYIAAFWLTDLAYMLRDLHGDEAKINACIILKRNLGTSMSNEYFEYDSKTFESILSVRLSDETFRGLLNVFRTNIRNTPKDEIEKALEYLYDVVPKADCTSEIKAQNEIL